MKRRRIRKSDNKGTPKWMVTYSDMVTLILVFFILLFSMSQVDQEKFEAVSESFQNRMILDFYPSSVPMDHPTENASEQESGKMANEFEDPSSREKSIHDEEDEEDKEDSLDALMQDVDDYLEENDLNDVISTDRTERGVVLVLEERVLFNSGEAEILDSGKPFLRKIGTLLGEIPNAVKVEGHADSRPISNYRYPSNWELSGARASSVIRYLIAENDFDEERFSYAGFGDTEPAAPNDSSKNLRKNRRVEIVILEDDMDQDEE